MFEHDNSNTSPLSNHEKKANGLGLQLLGEAYTNADGVVSDTSPDAEYFRTIASDYNILPHGLPSTNDVKDGAGEVLIRKIYDIPDPIEYQIAIDEGSLSPDDERFGDRKTTMGISVKKEHVFVPDPITSNVLSEERKDIVRRCHSLSKVLGKCFDIEEIDLVALSQTASPGSREALFAVCGQLLQKGNGNGELNADAINTAVQTVIEDDEHMAQRLIKLGINPAGIDIRLLRNDVTMYFDADPTDAELQTFLGHKHSLNRTSDKQLKGLSLIKNRIREAIARMRAPKKLVTSFAEESKSQEIAQVVKEGATNSVDTRFHPEAVNQIDDLGGFVLEFMKFLENHGCQKETFFTAIVGLLPNLDESGTSYKNYFVKSCYLPALEYLSNRSSDQEISEAA